MTVSQVAREHQIVPSIIFRWRAELGFGKNKLAQLAAVRLADKEAGHKPKTGTEAVVLHDLLPVPDGFIAVELPDGRRVFAPAGSDLEAVQRHVAEREAQP